MSELASTCNTQKQLINNMQKDFFAIQNDLFLQKQYSLDLEQKYLKLLESNLRLESENDSFVSFIEKLNEYIQFSDFRELNVSQFTYCPVFIIYLFFFIFTILFFFYLFL